MFAAAAARKRHLSHFSLSMARKIVSFQTHSIFSQRRRQIFRIYHFFSGKTFYITPLATHKLKALKVHETITSFYWSYPTSNSNFWSPVKPHPINIGKARLKLFSHKRAASFFLFGSCFLIAYLDSLHLAHQLRHLFFLNLNCFAIFHVIITTTLLARVRRSVLVLLWAALRFLRGLGQSSLAVRFGVAKGGARWRFLQFSFLP